MRSLHVCNQQYFRTHSIELLQDNAVLLVSLIGLFSRHYGEIRQQLQSMFFWIMLCYNLLIGAFRLFNLQEFTMFSDVNRNG
jgi:hypothetical protein